jgi:hypothetical protein
VAGIVDTVIDDGATNRNAISAASDAAAVGDAAGDRATAGDRDTHTASVADGAVVGDAAAERTAVVTAIPIPVVLAMRPPLLIRMKLSVGW